MPARCPLDPETTPKELLPPRVAGRQAHDSGLPAARISPQPLSTQVELLVMKALSVGLVRGSIDEVDERVHMTWVQPRVLDLQQVIDRNAWFSFKRCSGLYLCA